MNIDPKKIEYLNKKADELVLLITEENIIPSAKGFYKLEGSLGQKGAVNLSDVMEDKPYVTGSITYNGETLDLKECYKNKCIGFYKENYKEFAKFIDTIYKIREINCCVSKKFISKCAFQWIIEVYKRNVDHKTFTEYLFVEIQSSIKEYKISFPILYLEIESPFIIGTVKFEYFSQGYIEKLIEQKKDLGRTEQDDSNKILRELIGQVIASSIVKAEYNKAIEIALEQCSLSMDILKICSITSYQPDYQISYDLDRRVKENINCRTFIVDCLEPLYISINFERIAKIQVINSALFLDLARLSNLSILHNFLLSNDIEENELKKLIINSFKRYSKAITNKDLNERVVELFTILESLLLKDQNSPIIESVCKYCSKLISSKAEERKYAISLLKDMYEVRSAMIHHAKKKEVELSNMKNFQLIVIDLFLSLINKSNLHKSKESLLNEIDDAIMNAY